MMIALIMDYIDTVRLLHEEKELEIISSREAVQQAKYDACCRELEQCGMQRSTLEKHGDFATSKSQLLQDKPALARDLARDTAAKVARTEKCEAIKARRIQRQQRPERQNSLALRITSFF
jgi:hypothetical protein